MTDASSPWQAPGGSVPPPPRYGEMAPPGWTPPPPAPGWTPPPKPGLIPLRPLGVGDVTAAAFGVIRRNPRPTFGFALLVSLGVSLVSGGIVGVVTWAAISRAESATGADVDAVRAGSVALVVLAALVAVVVQLVCSAIPQGVVALEVARATLGERRRLRDHWQALRGRIGALIGWTLLVAVAVGIVVGLLALPLLAIAASGGAGPFVALGLGLILIPGLIVLSVWLGTKLEFVPSLIVIERLPIGPAMRRSWALTRGGFWRIFGITLLVNVIVQFAAQIVTTPISVIGSFAATVLNPNQTADAAAATTIGIAIVALAVGVVVGAITLVAQSAVPALLYLDARMRREGLDVVLQRTTEATAAGRTPPDPFG